MSDFIKPLSYFFFIFFSSSFNLMVLYISCISFKVYMGRVRLKYVVLFLLLSHQLIMTSAVVTNNRLLLAVGLATGAVLSSYCKPHVFLLFITKVCPFMINREKTIFLLRSLKVNFYLSLLFAKKPRIYSFTLHFTSFV